MSILDELRRLVAKQLEVEEKKVVPSASFRDDLGADSLDLVELVMALEERFKIEISDEDADKLIIVQDALDYLRGKGVLEST